VRVNLKRLEKRDRLAEQKLQAALELSFRDKNPLRTLWVLFQGHRPRMLLAMVMYAFKSSPAWVLPIVTGIIVTHAAALYGASQPGHPPADPLAVTYILLCAGVLFIFVVQNIPTHTLYSYHLSVAVRSVQMTLRSALVVRLQQLSMSFHDRTQSGKLQSKVLRDVEAVEGLSRMLTENLLQCVIMLTVALGVTLYKRPSVALFFLCTVPFAALLMRLFHRKLRRRNEEFRREVEEMSARVSEMIDMIPITRAHAVEDTEVEQLHRRLLRIRHSGQQLDMVNNLFIASAWVTFQVFQLLCLLFNVWQCWHGWITIGDVVMYQGFFGMLVGAVQQGLAVVPQLSAGAESIRSIAEVLESPDVEHNEGKTEVQKVVGRLTFEHVTFQYPGAERPAIADLSLDITPGQCVAVVGESGSGKSTLMSLIIGFRRPTGGRILLDGVDMATLNFRSFRRFLAVVPQQTVLFSGTVRDNITYGLKAVPTERLNRVLEMSNCAQFVREMPQGLDTPIGSHGGRLSGGQRQRLAIARALLRDPRVIILDEATSALDVISERLVQEAIDRLIAGRTTFIVAHRLSTIRHAHRILVMSNGAILESGTHDELLARPDSAFSRLHALQT
jgi:ATP-binding cassette subfamily B protein